MEYSVNKLWYIPNEILPWKVCIRIFQWCVKCLQFIKRINIWIRIYNNIQRLIGRLELYLQNGTTSCFCWDTYRKFQFLSPCFSEFLHLHYRVCIVFNFFSFKNMPFKKIPVLGMGQRVILISENTLHQH